MTDVTITSVANPRVKAALRLRNRQERDVRGLTIVDGAREVRRALEAGAELEELFVAAAACSSEACRAVLGAVPPGRRTDVADQVLDRLAYGDRSEGIVAVLRQPSAALAAVRLPPDPLVVVLEAVEKPGNVGAVLRSLDAAGGSALIAADARTDLFNPNAIRASLGTIFTVPVASGTSPEVRRWLGEQGLPTFAARVDADRLYTEVDLTGPVAFALGSEAEGLTEAWSGPDVTPIRLPMLGAADSLNVSVTAAVLLYEARRQRSAAATERR